MRHAVSLCTGLPGSTVENLLITLATGVIPSSGCLTSNLKSRGQNNRTDFGNRKGCLLKVSPSLFSRYIIDIVIIMPFLSEKGCVSLESICRFKGDECYKYLLYNDESVGCSTNSLGLICESYCQGII